MTLKAPNNAYDLGSIAPHEPFYVIHHAAGSEEMAAMMVAVGSLLVVNPSGSLSTVAVSTSSRQRIWKFLRYFNENETLSISGSIPVEGTLTPEGAALSAIDEEIAKIPTPEQVRANRSTAIIPDGLYFRIRGWGGSEYYCVNCPPGLSSSASEGRRLTVVGKASNYVQDTTVDLTQESGWEFLGYVLPDDVPAALKPYPKLKR